MREEDSGSYCCQLAREGQGTRVDIRVFPREEQEKRDRSEVMSTALSVVTQLGAEEQRNMYNGSTVSTAAHPVMKVSGLSARKSMFRGDTRSSTAANCFGPITKLLQILILFRLSVKYFEI